MIVNILLVDFGGNDMLRGDPPFQAKLRRTSGESFKTAFQWARMAGYRGGPTRHAALRCGEWLTTVCVALAIRGVCRYLVTRDVAAHGTRICAVL